MPPVPKIAVAIHLFNLSLIDEFVAYLQNIVAAGYKYDLYIAVPQGTNHSLIKKHWSHATILERENRGFDISSFLASLVYILQKDYDLILKLHSKTNGKWRSELIYPLLGTPQRVKHMVKLFENPTTGMVGSEKWIIPAEKDWGNNAIHIKDIAATWGIPLQKTKFIAGTIFMVRHSILKDAVSRAKIDLLAIANSLNTPNSVDWSWYLMSYPELKQVGVTDQYTAERHWLEYGQSQGRACNCLYARINKMREPVCDSMKEHSFERILGGLLITSAGKEIVGVSGDNLLERRGTRVLAMYHFQEDWTRVRANNRAPQPHTDLGYYLSKDREVLQRQLDMMSKYGIWGVVYRITDLTLLDHVVTTIPFCFSLMNGSINNERLRFWINHANYIKVNNRPVIVMDTPQTIEGFEIISTQSFIDLPKTHSLRFGGIVLGDRAGSFTKELTSKLTDPQSYFVIIRSWNDWEGQKIIEPSRGLGYKYLQEVQKVVQSFD